MAHPATARAHAVKTRPTPLLRPLELFVCARLVELRLLMERCTPKPLAGARSLKPRTLCRRPLI